MTRTSYVALGLLIASLAVPNSVRGQAAPAAPPGGIARPAAEPLRVQNVPPQLWQILNDWSKTTAGYKKLEGECRRFTYDTVFNEERRGDGRLYYESPDKGRIDMEPAEIPKGTQAARKDAKGVPFKLAADKPEKWICDGKSIMQIDEVEKQASMFEIPPQVQGQRIMDGPLPFLFGLPPQEAVQRFDLTLEANSPATCKIKAIPRRQQDAANYKQATIILDKQTYLPKAVQLIDPAGTKEIVYAFQGLDPNPKPGVFARLFRVENNPFAPNLSKYKVVNKTPPQIAQAPAGMPSLIGLSARDAKSLLDKAGIESKFLKGKPASRNELTYVVYEQNPPAKSEIPTGNPVVVVCFDKTPDPAAPPPTPKTTQRP